MKDDRHRLSRSTRSVPRRTRFFLAAAWLACVAPLAWAQAPLIHTYNLEALSPPDEITLTSSVSCGTARCDIAYSVLSQVLDREINIVWKDANGAPLVSADNSYPSNAWSPQTFGGYAEAVEIRKGLVGSALAPGLIPSTMGTADFTGTAPGGSTPCGVGYVCNDASYYYFPPSAFRGTPAGGSAARQGAAVTGAADAYTVLGTISVTQSSVFIDPQHPEDVGDRRIPFIEFASSVAEGGGQYLYRYVVTNSTGLAIPYTWEAAGLQGTLDPFASVQREFVSTAAPGVASSLPQWMLISSGPFPLTQDYASVLELYAPVPEPAAWLQFGLGLVTLGALRRSARRRGPRPH